MEGLTEQKKGGTATHAFAAMLLFAFLTLGVGLNYGAGAVFALADRCEMPFCLWGSERLRTVADELRHWHPESGALPEMLSLRPVGVSLAARGV